MPHLSPTLARDPHEAHRASTPLELLVDLTFVVAVAAASIAGAAPVEELVSPG